MTVTLLGMAGVGAIIDRTARYRDEIGIVVQIDRYRTSALLAEMPMNLGGSAIGAEILLLVELEAGARKNRQSDEDRAVDLATDRTMTMMRIHCWRGDRVTHAAAVTAATNLEISHRLVSLQKG